MTDTMRDRFEREYKTGDEIVDALSLCTNPDGTYQQALARMCFKWFCKGQAATADAAEREKALVQNMDSMQQTNEAVLKRLNGAAELVGELELTLHKAKGLHCTF